LLLGGAFGILAILFKSWFGIAAFISPIFEKRIDRFYLQSRLPWILAAALSELSPVATRDSFLDLVAQNGNLLAFMANAKQLWSECHDALQSRNEERDRIVDLAIAVRV
jgi:hypothetical protein